MSSQLSADAEIRGSLRKLRDRSREMVRNNPYAKQAKRTTQINVVGTGMKFQSLVTQVRGNKRDQRVNKAIEEAWADWCRPENCDTAGRYSFHQFEWLATGALPESGEAIFRIVRRPFGSNGVPLALQLIEADLLDEEYRRMFPKATPFICACEKGHLDDVQNLIWIEKIKLKQLSIYKKIRILQPL